MIKTLSQDDLKTLFWVDKLESSSFHWNLKMLLDLGEAHEFFGYFLEGQVVAFVGFVVLPSACEISVLATQPGLQKQGFMRLLLQHLINAMGRDLEIWLDVHATNLPAIRLYQSLGFKQVGLRPKYYSDGGDALLFSLALQL